MNRNNDKRKKKKTDLRTRYDGGGNVESTCMYKNGQKHGEEKLYYSSGTLLSRTNWKRGKKQGLQEIYYSTGQLQSRCTFNKGKYNGTHTFYDIVNDGKIIIESNYKDGMMHGLYRYLSFQYYSDYDSYIIHKYVYYNYDEMLSWYDYIDGNIVDYNRQKYNKILKTINLIKKLLDNILIQDLIIICSDYILFEQ